MRLAKFIPMLLTVAIVMPATAFALGGIGPRASITGTIQEIHISEKQSYEQQGGEIIVKASNGQIVTVSLQDTAVIISEGRLSRKQLIPRNLAIGMLVRIRGLRIDTKTLSASLLVILNIETNPVLSMNGILQNVTDKTITVLTQDGALKTLTITNETTVSISYDLTGPDALTLIGKQVLITLNPADSTLARIIRITGNKPLIRTTK